MLEGVFAEHFWEPSRLELFWTGAQRKWLGLIRIYPGEIQAVHAQCELSGLLSTDFRDIQCQALGSPRRGGGLL